MTQTKITEKSRKTGIYIDCPKTKHKQDLVMCFYWQCERRVDETHRVKGHTIKRCDEFWRGIEKLKEVFVFDSTKEKDKESKK